MPQTRPTGRGQVNRHTHPERNIGKRIYVTLLMTLLPLLTKIANAFSAKVRQEGHYCGNGFTLDLKIDGFDSHCALQRSPHSWKHLNTKTYEQRPDLVITFRDLDYAFDVFSGGTTLKDALSARLFTTHGPNDKGVSVTYMFTVILHAFFFWRAAYRR